VSTLLVFAAAAAALVAVPGPNVLFLLTRGAAGGRRVAVLSVFGVETATLCFVVAAALGLTAVLASSALVFAIVRYVGAAYLIYLGLRALRSRAAAVAPVPSRGRVFRQAFTVGISNPKVALFFLAFLPQFVRPDAGPAPLQILVLGLVFFLVALVLDMGWALLAGAVAGRLRRHPKVLRLTAPVYVGLGVHAATS
jgi:threonine/homoserine/homoserine lactone efflux protein